MTEPVIARKQPYEARLEAGKDYYWCACGKSRTQPFCDGSHKGSGLSPLRYRAVATGPVFFCGCKKTASAPLCDGTHAKL